MKKQFKPFKLELLKYSEIDILTSSSDVGGGGGGDSGGGGTSGGGSGLAPNEGPLIPA